MTLFLDRQPKTGIFCAKTGFLRNNLKKNQTIVMRIIYICLQFIKV
jgi:hypothetical protein